MTHVSPLGYLFVVLAGAIFVFYWNLRNHADKFRDDTRLNMETSRSRILHRIFLEGSLENLVQWKRLSGRSPEFAKIAEKLRAFLGGQQSQEELLSTIKDTFEKSPLTPEDLEALRSSSRKTVAQYSLYEEVKRSYEDGWTRELRCSDELLKLAVLFLVIGLALAAFGASALDDSLRADSLLVAALGSLLAFGYGLQRATAAWGAFNDAKSAQRRFEEVVHPEIYEVPHEDSEFRDDL